jgi:hypothetical protein
MYIGMNISALYRNGKEKVLASLNIDELIYKGREFDSVKASVYVKQKVMELVGKEIEEGKLFNVGHGANTGILTVESHGSGIKRKGIFLIMIDKSSMVNKRTDGKSFKKKDGEYDIHGVYYVDPANIVVSTEIALSNSIYNEYVIQTARGI